MTTPPEPATEEADAKLLLRLRDRWNHARDGSWPATDAMDEAANRILALCAENAAQQAAGKALYAATEQLIARAEAAESLAEPHRRALVAAEVDGYKRGYEDGKAAGSLALTRARDEALAQCAKAAPLIAKVTRIVDDWNDPAQDNKPFRHPLTALVDAARAPADADGGKGKT